MKELKKEIVQTFWGSEVIYQENSAKRHWPIIKFTTTVLPTSLQVCPPNETAIKAGYKNLDKNKAVVVLKSNHLSFIYAGIKSVSLDEMRKALLENKIDHLLKKANVSEGTFINIPTGLIHSFGPGLEILEIQNYTGETLRIHDWGRDRNGKSVDLKTEEALSALNINEKWELASVTIKQDTYKNSVATHIFLQGKAHIFTKCLVIDLLAKKVFVAEDEDVELENFLLVSLPTER